MRKVFLPVVCVCCLSSTVAHGWGGLGHKITGQLASTMLLPKVKSRVSELLDGQSLSVVSNWADSLKQYPEWRFAVWYHFEKIADGSDYLRTFESFPQEKRQLGGIMTAILEAEKSFLNPQSTKEEKAVALKFLVHFIGDAHQPLHSGRPEDNGGNKIIIPWNGQDVTLHSIWDTFLLLEGHPDFMVDQTSTEVQYANYLQQKYSGMPIDNQAIDDINAWMNESLEMRPAAYQFKDESEKQYTARFLDSVDRRLFLSGLRMARFINNMVAKEQQPSVRSQLRSAVEAIAGSISQFISLKPRPVTPPQQWIVSEL